MISAGAIIFIQKDKQIKYLLLKHIKNGTQWGFPKGQNNENENIKATAAREIKEETGLIINNFIENFKEEAKYSFINKDGAKINKKVIYFLGEVKHHKIKISHEHSDARWFLFEDAMLKLKSQNLKEMLEKANNQLLRK